MLHLCKLISTFHHNHLKRQIVISLPINFTLPMARPIVKPKTEASSIKQNIADRPKLMVLASALKRAGLLIFYRVFGLVSIAKKESLNHVTFFASLLFNFLILLMSRFLPSFWFFFLHIG